MPIAPSRACEWCMGSTWCHLSGFYGLEELTNLRYIHIIYNLNCPESQLLASPYLRKKRALWQWGCATSLRTEQCCWCTEHPRAAAVSCFFPLCLAGLGIAYAVLSPWTGKKTTSLPVFVRRLNAWLANGSFSVVNVFTDRVLLHFGVELNRENVQIIRSVFGVACNSPRKRACAQFPHISSIVIIARIIKTDSSIIELQWIWGN